MKTELKKITLVVFACLLAAQTNRVLAQTNDYNNADWSHIPTKEMASILEKENPDQIPTNAWTSILEKLKWSQIPTNVQQYIAKHVSLKQFPTNFDFQSISRPRPAWPDSPEKQERLKQSVDMLRSAVDTNQLAIIEKQLINELQSTNRTKTDNGSETITIDTGADMILCFHNFSKQMVSDLNEFADLLTDPKLETYSYGWGKAEIFSPHKNEGKVKFSF